ncbi:hypothetical protein P152DRAFT_462577 [Eremomyces bilateralis CBS 781.70]|uniref:Uncharacterized protein n=1 Tax=Eremomyces bilateralis CBS 781.70 TaxID=1392243 RepID=A0A6G1FRY1_9PEZI|nr:uncharacterized protein P152DRAFT_462577 [Eremomyces bilateralis CBS 781.70]KAF1808432.1 hypothetical protein P152DRAFT_462577 [Eremomyces bilateralis CBS 781.70]
MPGFFLPLWRRNLHVPDPVDLTLVQPMKQMRNDEPQESSTAGAIEVGFGDISYTKNSNTSETWSKSSIKLDTASFRMGSGLSIHSPQSTPSRPPDRRAILKIQVNICHHICAPQSHKFHCSKCASVGVSILSVGLMTELPTPHRHHPQSAMIQQMPGYRTLYGVQGTFSTLAA